MKYCTHTICRKSQKGDYKSEFSVTHTESSLTRYRIEINHFPENTSIFQKKSDNWAFFDV